MRRQLLMGLSWLVAAGAATSVGLVAVGFAGAGLSGPTGPSSISVVVSGSTPGGGDLTGQGSTPSSTPTSPEPTPTHAGTVTAGANGESTPATVSPAPTRSEQQHSEPASPSSEPATRSSGSSGAASTEVSDGGTVVADCTPGWPRLLSWWPAQEWSAGAAVQGSASNPVASVTFQHDQDLQKVSVTCRSGSPSFTVTSGSTHSDG